MQALKKVSDVPIRFEEIDGAAHGYYNRTTDSIAVKSGMSESQTVKTMIHEIAHSILHNDNAADAGEKNRRTKEVEAESVAYTVCKHFGIDTSDYSFGYIAGWSADKELSELKASLETIRKTSSGLITDIEDKLEKLRLDKDMNVSEQASKNVTESRPNVTESVTGELQHSRDMMMAALGSTGDLLSSYENKVKENTKFLQVLEKETNPGYEAFSPREFNSFHKEKMEELRADQKRISNEIMCLRDQMQEYEFRIADITSVIKEETEIERKIHEAADIDSYDTRLALLRSVETERQRIARELHDSTTQNLTAIVHKTELCSKIIESDPVKCKLELFSIGQTLRKIIEDTRGLIYDLRPMSFDDIGFDVTVERALDRFQRFHRIECGYYTEGTSYPINSVVQITLLRVIQEACNNAVKHAQASYLEVKVSYLEKKIVLVIKDDGKGFDVNAVPDETRDDNSGFGLSMMKERVYLLSGTISIESAPGKGCSIIVSIPKMKEDL